MAIKVGATATFKGYGQLADDQAEILIADETVRILGHNEEDDAYEVQAVDDEDRTDTVFSEELDETSVADAEADEADEGEEGDGEQEDDTSQVEEEAPAPVTAAKGRKAKATTAGKGRKAAATATTAEAALPKAGKARAGKAKPNLATAAKAEAEAESTGKRRGRPPQSERKPVTLLPSIRELAGTNAAALENAKELAEQVNSLREQEEQTLFQLGGLLAYIKDQEAFKELGFEDLPSYAETELGMKKRSAEYYIRIYTDLTSAGVTEKQIEGIGWTKLRALTGAITPENKTELLTQAKKLNRDDLAAHMKEVKARVGKANETAPVPEFTKFPAMRLHSDKAETLTQAINLAKEKFGVESAAEALFLIATDWLGVQDADVPLEAALEALNARYGTNYGDEGGEGADDYEGAESEAEEVGAEA